MSSNVFHYICISQKKETMNKIILSIILTSLFSITTIADEGMWLPQLLQTMNEEDMIARGLKLTAEDLYSINNSSLKDAIVALNGGSCTAEMISSEGLLLTNHHCAYGQIQNHSSVENDYLKNGFWAMNKNEELANEGLTASFLNPSASNFFATSNNCFPQG